MKSLGSPQLGVFSRSTPENKRLVTRSTRNVFHFSGGRSSAMMVVQNYKPGDLVIFCDTPREDPKTYKFLVDFEAFEGIPVIKIMMPGGWKGMLKKMKGIPNRFKRKCTLELKIKTARRYLRSVGIKTYIQFIGFRADEQERITDYKKQWKTVETFFPLNEAGIIKTDVNKFWQLKPYQLELPQILSNCDLCFLKGESNIIAILTNDISKADKWIDDEEDMVLNPHGYTYSDKHTMRELKAIAQDLINKGKVFNLEEMEPAFNCACTAI